MSVEVDVLDCLQDIVEKVEERPFVIDAFSSGTDAYIVVDILAPPYVLKSIAETIELCLTEYRVKDKIDVRCGYLEDKDGEAIAVYYWLHVL